MGRTCGLMTASSLCLIYLQTDVYRHRTFSKTVPGFGFEKFWRNLDFWRNLQHLFFSTSCTGARQAPTLTNQSITPNRFLVSYCSGSGTYFRYLIGHLKASVEFSSDLRRLLVRVVQLKKGGGWEGGDDGP